MQCTNTLDCTYYTLGDALCNGLCRHWVVVSLDGYDRVVEGGRLGCGVVVIHDHGH